MAPLSSGLLLLGRAVSLENLTIFCLALYLFVICLSLLTPFPVEWGQELGPTLPCIPHSTLMLENKCSLNGTKMSDSDFIDFKPGRKYQPGGRFCEAVRWLPALRDSQPLQCPRIPWRNCYPPFPDLPSRLCFPDGMRPEKSRWFCCRWPTHHKLGNTNFELYICKWIKKSDTAFIFSSSFIS